MKTRSAVILCVAGVLIAALSILTFAGFRTGKYTYMPLAQAAAGDLEYSGGSAVTVKVSGTDDPAAAVELLRGRFAMLYPSASCSALGSDMLLSFRTWREWQEILHLASLCAVSREQGDLPGLQACADSMKAECPDAEIRVLTVDAVEVSSTEIRQNLQNHADCSCLLPENVVQYISKKHLYGNCENQTWGEGFEQGKSE